MGKKKGQEIDMARNLSSCLRCPPSLLPPIPPQSPQQVDMTRQTQHDNTTQHGTTQHNTTRHDMT
jgi:hypothetical protein